MHLTFPALQRGEGSAGIIVENVDGRLGYAANSFSVEELLRFISTEGTMTLSVMLEAAPSAQIEAFQLRGGAAAAVHLTECEATHFPESG